MTRTRNYYTSSNHTDHSTFGGIICFSDFNTNYRGDDQKESSIAKRIISDWKFDECCRQNALSRDKKIQERK